MDTFGTEYTTKLSVFTKLGSSTAIKYPAGICHSTDETNCIDDDEVITAMLQQNWISTVFFLSTMLHNEMLTQDYLVLVTVRKVGQAKINPRLFHITLTSQKAAAELLPWRHGWVNPATVLYTESFQPYLLSAPFLIRLDHAVLQWLKLSTRHQLVEYLTVTH